MPAFKGFIRNNSAITAIASLSLALALTLLLVWIILFEISYDTHYNDRESIYRVSMKVITSESEDHYATTGSQLGRDLKTDYPAISGYASFRIPDGPGRVLLKNREHEEVKVYAVHGEVFDLFTCKFIEGSRETALRDPGTIVLTQTLSNLLFGPTKAVGQEVNLDDETYSVTGVIEDVPVNSDLIFEALIYGAAEIPEDEILQSHFNTDHYTFIKTEGEVTPYNLLHDYGEIKINRMLREAGAGFQVAFTATPLSDLHFSEPLMMDTPKGNMNTIYILSALSLCLLITGSANFLNIRVLSNLKKATGVGMLRVFGVSRTTVLMKMIAESFAIVFPSFVLALALVAMGILLFGELSGYRHNPGSQQFVLMFAAILVFMGIISILGGLIPALQLFRNDTATLLRERKVLISHKSWNQRILLGIQFAISMALISSTLELYRQYEYFTNHDPGFSDRNVLIVEVPGDKNYNRELEIFRNQLLSHSGIKAVSFAGTVPGDEISQEIFSFADTGNEVVHNFIRVDTAYFKLLSVGISAGRNFDRSADKNALVVNEAFQHKYADRNILETTLSHEDPRPIVGVVEDFHMLSLHNPSEPVIFARLDLKENRVGKILVKVHPQFLETVANEWQSLNLPESFRYSFLDDHFEKQYENEQRLLQIFSACSLLAIVLNFAGLFGLVALMIENRKRELAIRNVLGSTFKRNLLLLTTPILLLMILVFFGTIPGVMYFLDQWKQTFTETSEFSVIPYVLTIVTALALLAVTVILHLRSFSRRPVHELIRD